MNISIKETKYNEIKKICENILKQSTNYCVTFLDFTFIKKSVRQCTHRCALRWEVLREQCCGCHMSTPRGRATTQPSFSDSQY